MTDSTPLRVRPFTPLDALYAAIRRRLPQVLAAHVREQEYVRVTYRDEGPADLIWDAASGEYRWSTDATYVGGRTDMEEAIQNIAARLGAVTTSLPPPARETGGPDAADG